MRILHLINYGVGHLPDIDFNHQVTEDELPRFGAGFEQTLLRLLIQMQVPVSGSDWEPTYELVATIMPEEIEVGGRRQSCYHTLEERPEGGYTFTHAGNCGNFLSFYVIAKDEIGTVSYCAGTSYYHDAYPAFVKGGEKDLAEWCIETLKKNVPAILRSVMRSRNEARDKADFLWRKESALGRLKQALDLS